MPVTRSAADAAVLIAAVLGSAMSFIDGNVVTIALADIARTFSADLAGLQWVVEAYLLVLSALLLAGGAVGDTLGRKRIFLAGVVLFAVASAACGLAQSVWQLVAARAVQGLGAALLIPGSLALISAHFEGPARGRAIGIWSAASAITVAFAPLLGGWLIEVASWRLIFWINLPLAALVVLVGWRGIPESRDPDARQVDWTGSALTAAALGLVVFAAIELPRLGAGHWLIVASFIIGMVLAGLFVRHQRRCPQPMIPVGLFASRAFTGAITMTLALYAGLSGILFFLPVYLIEVQGYGERDAGAALLPFIIAISTLSPFAGRLVDRFGARMPLTWGPLIAAVGMALHALPGTDAGSYWTSFFPAQLLLGLGMAMTVAPLTTATMNAAPTERAGAASGLSNAASRVAFLLSVAGLGIVASLVFRQVVTDGLAEMAGGDDARMSILQEALRLFAAEPPAGLPAGQTDTIATLFRAASHDAFVAVALATAALALVAVIVVRMSFGPKGTNRAGRG